MKKIWLYLIAVLLYSSCAPTRFVETLDKGQHALGANFGGPLIEYSGAIIPVPLTSIYYGYGLDSNLTAFGGIHTTSLAFNNLQIDGGVTYKLLNQKHLYPSLSISPGFNFTADMDSPDKRFWPKADINLFWNHGDRNNCFYIGCNNWLELSATRAHNIKPEKRWLINPHIGYIFKAKKLYYGIEMKWLAPGMKSDYVFIPYKGITGNNGATGVFISVTKPF